MRNRVLVSLAAAVVVGSLVAYSLAFASTQRADCPGTATCPLTGEKVCNDRCPLLDPAREDCPGKIECPLTGELECRDECPLGDQRLAQ